MPNYHINTKGRLIIDKTADPDNVTTFNNVENAVEKRIDEVRSLVHTPYELLLEHTSFDGWNVMSFNPANKRYKPVSPKRPCIAFRDFDNDMLIGIFDQLGVRYIS